MGKPYRPRDHYFRKAKAEGFRARSAFKLEEVARRFALLRAGARVLDLGAAPGGFLQVVAEAVGPSGLAVGVDLVPLRPFKQPWVRTGVVDVVADDALDALDRISPGPYDAVLSDLAPKTSGIRGTDEARSLRLAERAREIARARGRPGSSFLVKVFMGGGFEAFREELRRSYAQVRVVRPEATRSASAEVYLVALGLGAPSRPSRS
ncbi:MAG TPA: RlmE family RNA methyltransferase [Myxococcaceae bacterium]|jgi:23S rRNA (uridine2552-2'-O)-methyltransferase|nr:RlmE family RNA methyltransferase [Myxococcaceae bacterium]